MKLTDSIASVNIDGKYIPISKGITKVGNIAIYLVLENKADNLYSWVVYLENNSDEKSPRIRELLGLDTVIKVKGETKFNTLRGDDNTIYSFFPESYDVIDGETITRSPLNGRPSDTTAFPYFDMEDTNGDGLVCGIGWTGQWKLDVTRKGDEVRLCAGFQDCDFCLEGHEKVRSVRILIYLSKGGEDKLRHQFVRLHRKYYSPVPSFNEDTYFPVSSQCFDRYYWGNTPKDDEAIYFETEDAQINIIDNAVEYRHINTFWIDACWFDGAFRTGVGNYRYAKGFPDKLKNIVEKAHGNGMRFVLWFEPVRAMEGTDVYNRFVNDNKKLIKMDKGGALVNLGDPDVWKYQFEHISKIIEENGVDIYRQDFNTDTYKWLKSIETEDRIGMAQIRFTEGIYKLWDALLERFPRLWIDNCASGGRLLDVETSMRAIPLWRSDMACRPSPAAGQNQIIGLSRYLPYHQGATFDYSPYFLRSATTTGVACEFGFLSEIINPEAEQKSMQAVSRKSDMITEVRNFGNIGVEFAAKSLEEALSLREYWNGDFTALTPPSDSRKAIIAYTLRLADEDRGIILVYRREEAPSTFVVKLPDVNCHKNYELTFSDEELSHTTKIVTGKELSDGISVSIDKVPGSLLVFYKGKE